MCIVLTSETRLSSTIIYAAEVDRPRNGPVHVLGYQNVVSSGGGGPSAMILPIPARGRLGPENVVDARGFPDVLRHYEQAVQDMKPALRRSRSLGTKGVSVAAAASYSVTFESGSYTVALADGAAGLRSAVDAVPDRRRPHIPTRFLLTLARLYPKWPLAICCFNQTEVGRMEPILWWYEPREPGILFAPAIDAHGGSPPENVRVPRDHTLAFGSSRSEGVRPGLESLRRRLEAVPGEHRWMFTPSVVGSVLEDERTTENGDFVMPAAALMDEKVQGYVGADQVRVRNPFLGLTLPR